MEILGRPSPRIFLDGYTYLRIWRCDLLRLFTAICLCIAFAAVVAGMPVTVFNDFGPGDTYMPGPGITVGCGAVCWGNAGYSHAWSFVPGVTSSFSSLQTAAWALGFAPPTTFVVSIALDAGGVPGSPLESFSVPLTSTPQTLLLDSVTHPLLMAGSLYWFTAGTADLVNQVADVGINSVGVTGPEALRIGNGPWSPTSSSAYGVFEVVGDAPSAIPEPSTALLLAAGAALLVAGKRAYKRSSRD
jgi:hypothetical protein